MDHAIATFHTKSVTFYLSYSWALRVLLVTIFSLSTFTFRTFLRLSLLFLLAFFEAFVWIHIIGGNRRLVPSQLINYALRTQNILSRRADIFHSLISISRTCNSNSIIIQWNKAVSIAVLYRFNGSAKMENERSIKYDFVMKWSQSDAQKKRRGERTACDAINDSMVQRT